MPSKLMETRRDAIDKLALKAGKKGIVAEATAKKLDISTQQFYAAAKMLRQSDRPDDSTFLVRSNRNTKGEVVGSRYYHSSVVTDAQLSRTARTYVRDAKTRTVAAHEFLAIDRVSNAAEDLVLEELGMARLYAVTIDKQRAISNNDFAKAKKLEDKEHRIAQKLIRAGVM